MVLAAVVVCNVPNTMCPVSAALIAKVSYRADRWQRTPAVYAFIGPGGHALALQLSQSFDVLEMFERLR